MISTKELVTNYIHAWLRRDAIAVDQMLHTDFCYRETIAGEMNKNDFFIHLQTWFGTAHSMYFTYDVLECGSEYAYLRYQSYFKFPSSSKRIKLNVQAQICCSKGKIIQQLDYVNLYDFSCQAYGILGRIFGLSRIMHKMLAREMRYTVWLGNPKMDHRNPKFKKMFPELHAELLANPRPTPPRKPKGQTLPSAGNRNY